MRTGQAHRSLLGHTAPVTCLQFDEMHIVSGGLDKTIRVSSHYSFLTLYLLSHRYGTYEPVEYLRLSNTIMVSRHYNLIRGK